MVKEKNDGMVDLDSGWRAGNFHSGINHAQAKKELTLSALSLIEDFSD